ncbi:MAG: RNA polymerase sporulation sigma factor SigH [Lachnospiraceae bacterium]
MEAWKEQSDEELIVRLRKEEGTKSAEIMDYLMEKYKYLVRKKANAMFLIGGDTDDLIQEGMIGLFKAVRDFRPDEKTTFYSFAELCISRQMYTAVEASRRQKHVPLNSYISIWGQESGKEDGILLDTLVDGEQVNPESLIIARENYRQMIQNIEKKLSPLEKKVFQLHLNGMTYQQIAEELKKTPKAIDNALQRIKGKIQ